MNERILLIDDDAKILLDYLTDGLKDRGYLVISALSLAEAKEILEDPHKSQSIACTILDMMFSLSEEDDPIFREYFGRDPTGPEDAMQAGLALIPILAEKKIPILVLTHVSRRTPIGRELWEKLDELRKDEVIEYAAEKPADDDFYAALEEACKSSNE